MNILLTGSSGFLGRNIAAALAAAGHRVLPASRRHGIDFNRRLRPDDWMATLRGVDAVVNCVGIIAETGRQRFETLHALAPIALFEGCRAQGVRRVVQISALGADAAAFSAYHLSKRRADDHLRGLDLDWFVLRPSLVYGRDGYSAKLFMRLAALPRIPVLDDGRQQVQPIHVRDVAATVVRSLASNDTRQTIDLAARESLGFAEWLQCMRAAQGLPPAPLVHIPFAAAMAAARIGRFVHPLLQPDNLRMLKAGYRADATRWVALLGREPLAIQASLFFEDVASTLEVAR